MSLDNLLLNSLLTRVKIEDPKVYRVHSEAIKAAYIAAERTFDRNNPYPQIIGYRKPELWREACRARDKDMREYALQKAIHCWDLKKKEVKK